ncbi:MAG: hypothetical protein DWQ36_05995 [Acidobacteria bacterium]|nr:MAG: hypothetical protein DWQ30_19000 [Acidobacteriota bacterium]REK09600.1 MAG: hypothetical protein DWQ36_05995 [Acidobacteriota bacterium]
MPRALQHLRSSGSGRTTRGATAPVIALALSLLTFACTGGPSTELPRGDRSLRVEVTWDAAALASAEGAEASDQRLDGRLLLFFARSAEPEPRFQVSPRLDAIPVYGVEVDAWPAGEKAVLDGAVFGFPVPSLDELPAGEYFVQALLHRYESFELASGHVVELPMDRGEGQQWRRAPGNLYSTPRQVTLEAGGRESLDIVLDQVIPAIEPPPATSHDGYVRHVEMRSELLSEFWGRDMKLGAHVLVPHGFDGDPDARYPLMIFHGHFPAEFGGFRTSPPDSDLECEDSARFGVACYNRIQQQEAYDFYRQWISPDFPRFLVVEIQHPNPYYDDSYAVNSANLGPYGDAITHELVPFLEQQFRGVGAGWGRFLYGGSTGGWEALAAQVFYPREYGGAFAACPDPIDFRAYMTVDLYADRNAYFYDAEFKQQLRPGWRNHLGDVEASLRDFNWMELALGGEDSKSGDQFDVWQAVYSPMDEDGYPKPIWDKRSGEIDPEVAAHWRENYDLGHILRRDWKEIGPDLVGKIHLYCGDMDNYYLNNAVYLVEEFLESTTDPYYAGVVDYGDRAEHCWNGDHENGNHISRLRYNTMYLPRIRELVRANREPEVRLVNW